MVQAHRTSSNLLEPHHYRDSKVCRVLSHEFGVVRPYRTFSVYIGMQGVVHLFGVVQAHRTSSNLLEPHHYKDSKVCRVCHMSSGWFDRTEPSLSTSLQGKQGVQGAYALVRGGSSTSNLIESSRTTSLQR